MVRGPIAGWYPYPFLDPANGGYGTVALYVVGIFVFGVVVATLLRLVGNALRSRRVVPVCRRYGYAGRLRIPNVDAGQ